MGSLDVDSPSTNIPLEAIDICVNQLFKTLILVKLLLSENLNNCYCLPTKESYFIINGLLYKETEGVAMESPLGPSFAKVFLSYYEKKLVPQLSTKVQTSFYRSYVEDIFVFFKSNDYLKYFQEFLNSCNVNMPFSTGTEKKFFSFLDVVVIYEQGKFTTRIYGIPTFYGVYSNCESFYPLFINVV